MNFRAAQLLTGGLGLGLVVGLIAGCVSRPEDSAAVQQPQLEAQPQPQIGAPVPLPLPAAIVPAATIDAYKRELAAQIARRNALHVYAGRPQALLRSVVVVRLVVDARGALVLSDIARSNRDRETEATALLTLRNAAPFPVPAPHLLRRGRLEVYETWLFNNDGRFQLRSIAEAQMDR